MREYQYKRSRWGFAGTLDRSLGEGSESTRNSYTPISMILETNGLTRLFDNTQGIAPTTGMVEILSSKSPVACPFLRSLVSCSEANTYSRPPGSRGKWRFPALKCTILGATKAQNSNQMIHFNALSRGKHMSVQPAVNDKILCVGWTQNCFTEAYSPANYDMTSINTSVGKSPQLKLLAAGAYAKQYHLWSHLSTIEVGGKFRNAHKFDNSYTPNVFPE